MAASRPRTVTSVWRTLKTRTSTAQMLRPRFIVIVVTVVITKLPAMRRVAGRISTIGRNRDRSWIKGIARKASRSLTKKRILPEDHLRMRALRRVATARLVTSIMFIIMILKLW